MVRLPLDRDHPKQICTHYNFQFTYKVHRFFFLGHWCTLSLSPLSIGITFFRNRIMWNIDLVPQIVLSCCLTLGLRGKR